MFKPFSKLDANKHLNPNGSGMGLNICKLICNNLGGDIYVESDGLTGTQFTFYVAVKRILENDEDIQIQPTSRHDI